MLYYSYWVELVNVDISGELTVFKILDGVVNLYKHLFNLSECFVRNFSQSCGLFNMKQVSFQVNELFLLPFQFFVYEINLYINTFKALPIIFQISILFTQLIVYLLKSFDAKLVIFRNHLLGF